MRLTHKFFKLPKVKNKLFDGSIITDGVAVTFSMCKIVKKTASTTKNFFGLEFKRFKQPADLALYAQILKLNFYNVLIGIDPGARLPIAGVRIEEPKREHIKIKNTKFRSLTKEHDRRYRLKKMTNDILEKSKSTISPNTKNYVIYTEHRLKWFKEKQNVFGQRKVARLKFKKFICVEEATYAVVRKIIYGDRKPDKATRAATKPLVCIGASKLAANSPIKGYVRTPQRLIISAFRRYADVVLVNEFRTTMLCSICHERVETAKSPHRHQFCKKCGVSWNRDVNAGNNILMLGKRVLRGVDKPHNFQRSTQFAPIVKDKTLKLKKMKKRLSKEKKNKKSCIITGH